MPTWDGGTTANAHDERISRARQQLVLALEILRAVRDIDDVNRDELQRLLENAIAELGEPSD